LLEEEGRLSPISFFLKRRAVGLDVGSGAIKALTLERSGKRLVIRGVGAAPVQPGADARQMGQAIHGALAEAGADGEPVVAAIGGPDVVVRQISLPPLPSSKILQAMEMQHRDFGLHSPDEAVLEAQVLRRAKDGSSVEVLAVSAPKALIEERTRLLQQAAVNVKILDVEPLALLNGALHLTGLERGELLIFLTIGLNRTVLCIFSEQGPVVARYLQIGAQDFTERFRLFFGLSPYSTEHFARSLSIPDLPRAEEASRELVGRMAEDIRMSLAFYRSEYDRESLPRYALGGWVGLPQISRWLADRLGIESPFELMDPFQAVEVKTPRSQVEPPPPGPQFLQAFGLGLRGL
jgi:type IV pilus assembly protein PilM